MNKINALCLTVLSLITTTNIVNNKTSNDVEYEIYPTVQNISYNNYNLEIKNNFNIVLDSKIDIYTKDKAFEVLSNKNVKGKISQSINDNKHNLLLGIYKSNEIINNYVKCDVTFIEKTIDSYYLSIDDKNIVILGKDTDSVFYGLSTLDLIFNQTKNTIRALEIKDYSSSIYRGFIEGYYGIPWTSEERKELMRFGSKFKSNIYIYAPKDDAYHSTDWQELYSENDLSILKEQIEVGLKTKTKLAWAIHPFMSNKITEANYDIGLTKIKNKFSQLYDAGIRQFVVSADDVGVENGLLEDATLHRKLLNDLAAFLNTKDGCEELIFVPSAYCYESEIRLRVDLEKYYNSLMNGLDDSIHIMWTGNDVCSSMENGKFEEFKALTNKKPFFWLNWPVNDYSTDHLLMGKGEVLNVKYTNNVAFEGIVTNPMPQAEPSKLAIFTVCDYSWNAGAFDMDKNYNDAFKYLESNEYEALKLISTHLTNATLYEGKYFEESKELQILIEEYNKTGNNLKELIEYFENVVTSIDKFIANCQNTKLKDTMLPWIEALKDASNAMINYLTILKDYDSFSSEELQTMLENANTFYNNSKEHEAPILNAITYDTTYNYADIGVSVLKPFMEKIKLLVNDKVKIDLGLPSGVTYSGFESIYQGSVENILDGDDSTYCWFYQKPSADAFIRIDLEEIKDIHDIKILFGNEQSPNDCLIGELYVSEDAKTYNYIGKLNSAEVLFDLRDNPVKARYIILKNTDTQTWVSIKEVKYNTLSSDEVKISYSGFPNGFGSANEHNQLSYINDNDLTTYVWFNWKCEVGANITLDLRQIKKINKIKFYQNSSEHKGDLFENCSFYVSKDNINYTKVGNENYLSQDEIEITLENIEARYVKVSSNVINNYGVCIREFIVE